MFDSTFKALAYKTSIALIVCLLFPAWAMSQSSELSRNGVFAHWNLDDVDDGIVRDNQSGRNGLIGANTTVLSGDGVLGAAASFNSSDDRIQLGTLNFQPGTQMSLLAWVWPRSFDGEEKEARFISAAVGVHANDHLWMLGNGGDGTALRFRLKTQNRQTVTLQTPNGYLKPNRWNLIVATYDGEYMKLFHDSTFVKQIRQTGYVANTSGVPAALGNQPIGYGSRPLSGLLDEVYIFNRALDADEIQDFYVHRTSEFVSTDNNLEPVGLASSAKSDEPVTTEVVATTNSTVVQPALEVSPVTTNIAVSTEGWPANSTDDLPLGGIAYGMPGSGIYGAANTRISREHSIRFRADRNGLIDTVSFQNRYLEDNDLDSRCASSGAEFWCNCTRNGLSANVCAYTIGNSYHVGNGGKIQIFIYADDGSADHRPDETKLLGRVPGYYIPTQHKEGAFLEHTLEKPVSVVAGGIYHIVIKNLAPPPALSGLSNAAALSIDPNVGAISLNGVMYPEVVDNDKKFGPFFGRHGKGTLARNNTHGPWSENPVAHAWWEVRYSDGVWVGETWGAWDVSFGHPGSRTIEGSVKARQIFTVEDATRRVNGVWLNYGHAPRSSINGQPLKLEVKDFNGEVLATAAIAADQATHAINKQTEWNEKMSRVWAYVDLSTTVDLLEGSTYSIEFSAPAGAGFAISALPYNFRNLLGRNRNEWENAHAELSTDGGQSWRVFHSGGRYPERDIPVLFTIENMPKQLP